MLVLHNNLEVGCFNLEGETEMLPFWVRKGKNKNNKKTHNKSEMLSRESIALEATNDSAKYLRTRPSENI